MAITLMNNLLILYDHLVKTDMVKYWNNDFMSDKGSGFYVYREYSGQL